MEQFSEKIKAYKNGGATSSPAWNFFEKDAQKEVATCLICKKHVLYQHSNLTGMQRHLKNCHGNLKKVNAAKIIDDLSKLRDERLQQRDLDRKKRRLGSVGDMSSDAKKQKTIVESIVAPKYNQSHPQQKKITNAMTAMLCLDGRPVNLVNGDGFKHLMETVDPRYTIPAPSTFQRTHIPKMKQAVEARLKESCKI